MTRRMAVSVARVAALFLIIVGVSGVLVPALTRSAGFYVVAAVFAIVSFFLLSPPRRKAVPAPAVAESGPSQTIYLPDENAVAAAREEERKRWEGDIKGLQQQLSTAEGARTHLKSSVDELTKTIQGLREQTTKQEQAAKEQTVQLTAVRSRQDDLTRTVAERDTELKNRERKISELQRALDSERGDGMSRQRTG